MKKIVKQFSELLVIGTLAIPLATTIACSPDGNTINPEGTLTVAVWKGNDVELAAKKNSFAKFTEKTGIPIEIIYYAANRVEDISRWAAAGDMPDVLLLDSGDVPSLASTETILPIKGNDFVDLGDKVENHEQILANAKNFKGLVNNVFAPLVGKVENSNYSSGETIASEPVVIDEEQGVSIIPSSGIAEGANVYALPKDFSTLAAYINVKSSDFEQTNETNQNLDFANDRNNFTSIGSFLDHVESGLALPKKAGQKGEIGKLGVQIDLARKISLLNDGPIDGELTFYEKYKDYNASQIIANKTKFTSDLKTALKVNDLNSNFNKFLKLRKDKIAVSPTEHKYGWNGEAFDNKAVSAVIEGNWFTPQDKANTRVEAIDNYSGIYYSAYAISAGNNDLADSYQFLQYMTFGDGAIEGTESVGLMPPNVEAVDSLYQSFASKIDSTDVNQAFEAKSFLAHAKAINNATPNLLTKVYTNLLSAWGETIKESPEKTADKLVDEIVEDFFTKIEETL